MQRSRLFTVDFWKQPDLQRKSEVRLVLFLFVLAFCSFLPFFSLYQNASINDEGQIMLGALRLWLGQAIYTDFNTHIAPGTYYLTYLTYLLLGPTMFATRLLTGLITAGIAVTVYLLARRCLPWQWSLAPYLLFVTAGVTQWPILSYHWLAALAFLLGTLALTRYVEEPSLFRAVVCGASVAFCGWVLQSGVAALLLLTGVVALFWRRTLTWRAIGLWVAGLIGMSLVLWGPILLKTTVAEIWTQNVEWTLGKNVVQGRAPFLISNITDRWSTFWSQYSTLKWNFVTLNWVLHSLSYLLVWSCNYLLFYPVLLLAVGFAIKHRNEMAPKFLVLAHLSIVLTWSSRQTLLYLNFLTPLFFILFVWILYRLGRTGLLVTVLLCSIYSVGYLYQWRGDAAKFVYPIRTVRGVLYADNPGLAKHLSQRYAAAYHFTPPGTPAFCFPYSMGFYFLSGVEPVGPLLSVIPVLAEGDDVSGQVAALDEHQVEYVYMFPWSEDALHAVPFLDEEKFWVLVKQAEEQILENYEQVNEFPERRLYKRKAELL